MDPDTQKEKRSHRTRDALIRAAEALFSRYGVSGVSLNTITRQAGQHNRNAIQYHFGNKTGLLQAIFDKHGPGLGERRAALVDEIQRQESVLARHIARVIVESLLEKLDDVDGGEAFIHISAELITDSTLGYMNSATHTFRFHREPKLSALVTKQLEGLPRAVAGQRVLMVNGLAFHSLSDYARLSRGDETDQPPQRGRMRFMANNLVDCLAAMLQAPASETTLNSMLP